FGSPSTVPSSSSTFASKMQPLPPSVIRPASQSRVNSSSQPRNLIQPASVRDELATMGSTKEAVESEV
ncbi:hypothetical protein PENTCL1PPCAC_29756, partial [Pristionchus entomophagus]